MSVGCLSVAIDGVIELSKYENATSDDEQYDESERWFYFHVLQKDNEKANIQRRPCSIQWLGGATKRGHYN